MTLGDGFLAAIVVLLMMTCGLLGYGVKLLQDSVKMQRRLVRMWMTLHRPTDLRTQEERPMRAEGGSDAAWERGREGWGTPHAVASQRGPA